ncbi:hypothetical protein [uncultured Mucilaginibacter sp.]|uniref:hypothetical protein n=1 Tax=uncultured Mucilaginibacter sp. TaxID=797541 RepID=UPI0025D87004|nr:hypothetical protein [uncultured Mucilaginibacter sp.]
MERIVLEVDDALAKTWNNSSKKFRKEYESKITDVLREMKEEEFFQLIDKAGKIAKSNGLTEEKLNELLNEKD